MCGRSACSSVTGPAFGHFDPPYIVESSGSAPVKTLPVDRITDLSMRFCNSRSVSPYASIIRRSQKGAYYMFT
jgi:hypothetical protein